MLSFGFKIHELIAVRNVGTMSGIEWAMKNPQWEILGVLISLKLMWVIIFTAIILVRGERKFLLLLIAASFSFTLLGVDTSRLMGYMFLPFIISFYLVKKNAIISENYLNYVMLFNLIIPSVYIGTNIGIVFFDGLYQMMFCGVLIR